MRKTAACVLLVVLGACAQRSAAEVLSAAPAAAKSKSTAAMSLSSTTKFDIGGRTISVKSTADGAMDLVHRRGKMRLVVSGGPVALQPCDMVTDGGIAYLGIAANKRAGDGKLWEKVDIAKATGIDVNSMSTDPTAQLDYLKSASGDVQTVGKEDVRGTPTTHYRFTVTADQLFAKLPEASRARLKTMFSQLGITTLPIDAWLDDDGLPRRISTDLKGTKSQASFDVTSTVEMYDYGKPVNVTIPPAAQVRDGAATTAFTDCFGISAPTSVPA